MCVHCPDSTSQKVNSFMSCAAGKNVTCEASSSGKNVASEASSTSCASLYSGYTGDASLYSSLYSGYTGDASLYSVYTGNGLHRQTRSQRKVPTKFSVLQTISITATVRYSISWTSRARLRMLQINLPRETYDQTGRFLKITSYDILL